MKILEFQTQKEAENCLFFVNQLAANYWQGLGYPVINDKLTGRNAKTQLIAPNKAKTTTWSEVQESPDNTFYFKSLTDTEFTGAMEFLIDAGFTFAEKEKPISWNETSNIGA